MTRMRMARGPLVAALALATAACTPSGDRIPEDEQARLEGAADPVPVAMADSPDTTATAMWEWLQSEAYADAWPRWPDTEPYYAGSEPHGVLLNTWLNETALGGVRALRADVLQPEDGTIALPAGAVVVKQNHGPDSALASVTVMYKVPGYDPEHGDWWWMKRLPDGQVEAAGRVASCAECHAQAAEFDYLMTARARSSSTLESPDSMR